MASGGEGGSVPVLMGEGQGSPSPTSAAMTSRVSQNAACRIAGQRQRLSCACSHSRAFAPLNGRAYERGLVNGSKSFMAAASGDWLWIGAGLVLRFQPTRLLKVAGNSLV